MYPLCHIFPSRNCILPQSPVLPLDSFLEKAIYPSAQAHLKVEENNENKPCGKNVMSSRPNALKPSVYVHKSTMKGEENEQ